MNTLRINLLPPEIIEKRRFERILFVSVLGFVFLLFGLFIVYTSTMVRVAQYESSVVKIERERDELKRKISLLQGFEDQKRNLKSQEEILERAVGAEVPWHEILYEVGMVIPSDVWLSTISTELQEGTVLTFQGYTFGHASVAEWLARLSQVSSLRDVWLKSSEETKIDDSEVVEFEITAGLSGAALATTETQTEAAE
ncbi:MAG: PilN domain-containing protein [Terriglobia bacterium]